jgi:hypothetical protein
MADVLQELLQAQGLDDATAVRAPFEHIARGLAPISVVGL